MGAIQDRFAALLHSVGGASRRAVPRPGTEDVLASPHTGEIMRVYRCLGGVQSSPTFRPGLWDLELNGAGVEFDEHLHFNRYRHETLGSPLYELLPTFPLAAYIAHCDAHEQACLAAGSYGGKWSNSSCETQFGPAGPKGDLSSAGAPRWRQRAFYDFLKDLSPLLIGVRMARVAIWDEIGEPQGTRSVADAVRNPSRATAQSLADLVRRRTA